MKEYAFSSDGHIWYRDIEEMGNKEVLYIGEVRNFNHEYFVDVDDIIETIQERACNEIGANEAEDYLSDIPSLDREDLRKMIVEWLDTYASKSLLWKVEKTIKVGI